MNIEKETVKESFINMQERKGSSQKFPVSGELSKNWQRKVITLKELWHMNPQLYIGYRIDEKSNKPDGDSGHLTEKLWKITLDSRAQNMTQALKVLREENIYLHPQISQDLEIINKDLALIAKVPEYSDIPETPLILLNDKGILPYAGGQVVDGTRRILALFESLTDGEIDDSLPIPIYMGDFPTASALAYNTIAFALDNKPILERISLLEERTSTHKYNNPTTTP